MAMSRKDRDFLKKDFYTIGEVAKIMNMTTKALRHYDHIDILKPTHIDPETKYRYYTYEQLFMIDVIKYLNKVLFIPLEEIKRIFKANADDQSLTTIFQDHQRYLQKKIKDQEYALQLISNLIEERKENLSKKDLRPRYESYLLERNFYYKEMNVPIEEIDKYVNRGDFHFIQHDNIENDTMCLMFSLSDFLKQKHLYVKGFGLFSTTKIDSLASKRIPEGRYINRTFQFSEGHCEDILEELLQYRKDKNLILDDTILLLSKTVDFRATTKYDYTMTLQVKRDF